MLQCVAVFCSAYCLSKPMFRVITKLPRFSGALLCVAACCSVLQRVAVCCSALQCVAVCCSAYCHSKPMFRVITTLPRFPGALQYVAVCCIKLQRVAVCCIVLQCDAMCSDALQCIAVRVVSQS